MNNPTGVVNIRGKQYTTVAKRITDFRQLYANWSVTTSILHRDDAVVIMRAEIADEHGRVLATGHAEEWRKASEINRTSAIENAETSAIGRALASLGYGGTEFASADEIEVAVRKQQTEPRPISGKQVAVDAFEALPPDEQNYIREQAMECLARHEAQHDAASILQYMTDLALDHDKTLALWSLLPSDLRAAVKKAKLTR